MRTLPGLRTVTVKDFFISFFVYLALEKRGDHYSDHVGVVFSRGSVIKGTNCCNTNHLHAGNEVFHGGGALINMYHHPFQKMNQSQSRWV